MVLSKIQEVTFATEDAISSIALLAADEWVMLLSSGTVTKYKVGQASGEGLFTAQEKFLQYSDGGFDVSAPSVLYALGTVAVVVNDRKTHGYVYNEGKYSRLHLYREDYHADITPYPIALYCNDKGIPHIIYSVAWNHLQIMDLDTRLVLTADKSLIKEGAEKHHIEFYQQYPEDNKMPWPRPYDYFFGALLMSPGNTKFLSKGWIWGSQDYYNVYDITDFISNRRISHCHIDQWEHCSRSACWIDEDHVAVLTNAWTDGEEGSKQDAPTEICIYELGQEQATITKKIIIGASVGTSAQLHYSRQLNVFIVFDKENGLSVFSSAGDGIFRDPSFFPFSFDPSLNLFASVRDKTVLVHALVTEW